MTSSVACAVLHTFSIFVSMDHGHVAVCFTVCVCVCVCARVCVSRYRNLDNGKTVTDQLTIVRGRDSCKYTQACFVALRDTYCDTYIVIGLLGQPKSLSSLSYYGR